MNRKYIIACLIVLSAGCAASHNTYSPSISNLPNTEEGTIFIRASGYGKNYTAAYENSITHAFNTLLFQGVPESIQSRPMIDDEAKAKQQNPGFFNCFTDKNCYAQFLTTVNKGGSSSGGGNYSVTNDIKINIRALRTYLEKNNIIRKFGY